MNKDAHIILYTGDALSWEEIQEKTKKTFNIHLLRPIETVLLKNRRIVEAQNYPRFTLLMQSLASIILGWNALSSYCPNVFIDTMGYSFTYPIAKIFGGCKVACYTHYPIISTDMLKIVSNQIQSHVNDERIAKSKTKTFIKLVYYKLFAILYGITGYFCDVAIVNSSWTYNHIKSLWWCKNIVIGYPPVDVSNLLKIETPIFEREPMILSVGQFRPEKNHKLQLTAFEKLLNKYKHENAKLILLGGCRDSQDQKRVDELKKLANDLNISKNVEFCVNAPYDQLTKYLSQSLIGLHTMWNEHFGICVVEYMAAGLITLAHNSGGPKMDIVVENNSEKTGYLAETDEEYAQRMHQIITLYEQKSPILEKIQKTAREQTKKFSEEEFKKSIQKYLSNIFG